MQKRRFLFRQWRVIIGFPMGNSTLRGRAFGQLGKKDNVEPVNALLRFNPLIKEV
jgi:hypothetical protein